MTTENYKTFGYKMGWYAIRCDEPDRVVAFLQLREQRKVLWQEGIESAYEGGMMFPFQVAVSPVVDGWTLVISHWCETAGVVFGNSLEPLKIELNGLSKEFGDVQVFSTHRVSEYHLWMHSMDGQIVRAMAYDGSSGEVLESIGDSTDGEPFPVDKLGEDWFPSEEDVMAVAGNWSVNPQTLDDRDDLGDTVTVGILEKNLSGPNPDTNLPGSGGLIEAIKKLFGGS